MLRRLSELGMLAAIHPDLPEMNERLEQLAISALRTSPPAEWNLPEKSGGLLFHLLCAYLVWLLGLPQEKALAVANHLRLAVTAQEMLTGALRLERDLPALEGRPVSQVVKRMDETALPSIYTLHLTLAGNGLDNLLVKYATAWRHIWPFTSGEELQRLGLPPGPAYKEILSALRAAWLDGNIHSQAEENNLLGEMLRS
jgi:tRNA nucleotidyltransferase (CCA-adding enzyme)